MLLRHAHMINIYVHGAMVAFLVLDARTRIRYIAFSSYIIPLALIPGYFCPRVPFAPVLPKLCLTFLWWPN